MGHTTERGGTLTFPNPSRSYDETRPGVRFWGYDRTFEVSFFIDANALAKVSPETGGSESGVLDAFDHNRERICAAAIEIYSRPRNASDPRSFVLTAGDV